MSYLITMFLVIVSFCIGIMAGMIFTCNAIIEIISGLVDFLLERKSYTFPDDDDSIEE